MIVFSTQPMVVQLSHMSFLQEVVVGTRLAIDGQFCTSWTFQESLVDAEVKLV